MSGPRRDNRGIVDAHELFSHVHFRRREPARALRTQVAFYWLIDWDLPEPYISHVVPHPSVNLVFQHHESTGEPAFAEVAGIALELFRQKLEGRGRVCGVKFRPGGFRPFAPDQPVSQWSGRRLTADDVLAAPAPVGAVLDPAEADARVAAMDAYLLALAPEPDPRAERVTALVERVRTDRAIRRVDELARSEGVSARSLQRLFAAYVGIGPKWVILRYRIHEALERAETDPEVDWATLATELGYSDQAHLVRDFTATLGVPPTALAGS
jgi:AraC-like DNA-binding protein